LFDKAVAVVVAEIADNDVPVSELVCVMKLGVIFHVPPVCTGDVFMLLAVALGVDWSIVNKSEYTTMN
jgi:hypothetical protein